MPPVEHAIGVLIVADVRVCRDELVQGLARRVAISSLHTATCADDALAQARQWRPAVILIQMGMSDGIRAVRALARELAAAKIVVLGVPECDAITWIEAGAAGCVAPEASLAEVVASVARVHRGESLAPPGMTAVLIERVQALAAERAERGLDARLTPREEEIIALIDRGLSNKQIAQSLCIEQATVKNHVHNILQKLNVDRRGEAAAAMRGRLGTRHVNLSN